LPELTPTEPDTVGNSIDRRQSRDRALQIAVSASIIPTARTIGVLYASLVVLHPLALDGPHRWTMAVLAAVSSVVCLEIARRWSKQPRPQRAITTGNWLAGVALVNTAVHFLLYPEASNTTNFIVLILAVALVSLSRVTFYSVVVVAGSAWASTVLLLDVTDPSDWGWFLFFSVPAAVILQEQRIHSTLAAVERENVLIERSATLQALVKAPELTVPDPLAFLERLAETACRDLRASSVSIWLRGDEEKAPLRRAVYCEQGAQNPSGPLPDVLEISPERMERLLALRTLIEDSREEMRTSVSAKPSDKRGPPTTLEVGMIADRRVAGIIQIAREDASEAWALEDQVFAASIADMANLALQTRERLVLERRAREAERLESLGILAGGVAHDFNNLLTVILGNTDLLQTRLASDPEQETSLRSIVEAGERARDLAQQMLAYSGRATRVTKTLDLATFAADVREGWARDLLEGIEVRVEPAGSEPCPVDVDATQIRQVILNLLTNARDAEASTIRISAGSDGEAPSVTGNSPIELSPHHWLEVEDNGRGMDAKTQERIFEPFYTTRNMGTGLGLAAALGIMHAHMGSIRVDSAPGAGSRFRILLPRSNRVLERSETRLTRSLRPVEDREVIVVEDEGLISQLVRNMLEQSGRTVHCYAGLTELEEALQSLDLGRIEFALVDLTLVDGSGVEAIELLRAQRAELAVVLMSGYDARDAMSSLAHPDTVEFLAKPFARPELQQAIEQALPRVSSTAKPS